MLLSGYIMPLKAGGSIDVDDLYDKMEGGTGISVDYSESAEQVRVGLDLTNAASHYVMKVNQDVNNVEWSENDNIDYKNVSGHTQGEMKFVKCTQAEYDDLDTPDANTFYIIVD